MHRRTTDIKNYSRRIALFLAAAFVCCPLLGCESLGLVAPKKNPVIDKIEFDQEYYDSLEGIEKIEYERSLLNDSVPEELFFNGQTFGILCSSEDSINDWQPEEQTGDRLNDAIHDMNQYVEDRLNIKLVYLAASDKADDLIAIDDKTYSIVTDDYKTIGWYAADGMLRDWETMPHMDLDAPWWNQSAREAVQVAGRSYLMVGASNIQEVRVTYCVYFNKALVEKYKSVMPDLYGLVDSGQWTLDKFIELSRIGYIDLNGNQEEDLRDQYGLAAQTTSYAVPFLYSCGETTTARDENGLPYIKMNNEKMVSLTEKVFELIYGHPAVYPTRDWSTHSDIFAEGRAMFMYGTFAHALMGYFSEMKDPYGFLPYPKWDELQQNYYTITDPSGSAFGIMLNSSNDDMTGAVMEVMNARAWKHVQPALYEAALKGRKADTADDARMIDLINRGVVYDFGYVFGGPGELLSKMMTHRTKDYYSQYRSRLRDWEHNLEGVVDMILEAEG